MPLQSAYVCYVSRQFPPDIRQVIDIEQLGSSNFGVMTICLRSFILAKYVRSLTGDFQSKFKFHDFNVISNFICTVFHSFNIKGNIYFKNNQCVEILQRYKEFCHLERFI